MAAVSNGILLFMSALTVMVYDSLQYGTVEWPYTIVFKYCASLEKLLRPYGKACSFAYTDLVAW